MSDDERFGSAFKPLKVKCLSIGNPNAGQAYLCLVDVKGRQFYFDLDQNKNELLHYQTGKISDAWPAPAKTS
jgi:hypothetical protein